MQLVVDQRDQLIECRLVAGAPGLEQGEREQLGPPPSVGFNANFNWDFDPSDGIDAGAQDFDGTAVHEIGHVLGFNSNVGAQKLGEAAPVSLNIWDLYRLRPGTTLATFATDARVLSSGGEQVMFVGGAELPLSTGRGNGTGGDGRQASHWKDDALTGQYVGIMDPTSAGGERQTVTINDLIALQAFGYRLRPTADSPTLRGGRATQP